MKTAIIGPGAMGILFAHFLVRSGEDIYLIDHCPDRTKRLNQNGLRVEGIDGEHKFMPRITSDPEGPGEIELVIVCVKSYDTQEAIKRSSPLISRDTTILTLQNGLGNLEVIRKLSKKCCVLGGTTSHGATTLNVGEIRHAGVGETIIGNFNCVMPGRLKEVISFFKGCGVDTSETDDVRGLIWSKLLVNVGINALTAITRMKNGSLLDHEGTRDLLAQAVLEGHRVAKAKGLNLLYKDPVEKVESVARATEKNISSMLQDVLNRRRTEVDYINGAIVNEGKELGLETPINQTLTQLVKTIEESYEELY